MLYELFNIDAKTLLVVLFWGNLACFVSIACYYFTFRRMDDFQLGYFFLFAKFTQAIAYFLMFSQEHLSVILSINLGSTLILMGFFFEACTMLSVMRIEEKKMYVLEGVIVLISITLFNIMEVLYQHSSIRITIVSLGIFCIMLIPSCIIVFSRKTTRFKRMMGLSYVFVLLFILPRIFYSLTNDITITSNVVFQIIFYVSLLFILFFSLPAYLLMSKEKTDLKIEQMSYTDPLTQLYNRRYFLDIGVGIFARNKALQNQITILFLDIDHFKRINDTYGHSFGDTVLTNCAEMIKESIRPLDISCRYGGEEFLVLISDNHPNIGKIVARRIMENIGKASFPKQQGFKYTVSIGIVSSVPGLEDELETFIDNADVALYRAKNNGRHRIEMY